jgi:1,4-alpha-glucan branching enzyme
LRERLAQDEAGARQPPLAVSPYDAELFGHWWAEGPRFLEHVFRNLAAAGDVLQPVTPSEFLARYPDCDVAEPQLSSWGSGGYLEVWVNPRNDWIYPLLERSARRMVELARHNPHPAELVRRALNQAARELLLAQSSDWAFMMNAGTTVEYAERRTRDHVAQFERLAVAIEARAVLERELCWLEARDDLFPEIDFRVYT